MQVNMGRYWNRLVRLSDDRLTKKSISMGFRSEIEGWAKVHCALVFEQRVS